ncbi:MAG TPA: DUF4388 domain-containing protein [Myxococcales bacterium]|nr:DUF4388 domain-containing protein [Myxococcales bacterium]
MTRKGSGTSGTPAERSGARGGGRRDPSGAMIEREGAQYVLLDICPDLVVGVQEQVSGLLADARTLASSGAVLAGDLSIFPPADLLNFLHNGERDGVLLARSDGCERAIVLIRGNVAWASSSSPGERLGEVACRLGLVERPRLQQIVHSQRDPLDRRRIGQLLVDSGALNAQDLARAVRQQVVEIFLGLLVARSGSFIFFRGCDPSRLPSNFALDTEALLLDGLRRLDEMELFRGRVPGLWVRPRRTGNAPADELSADAQLMLAACDGARTLARIAGDTALGDFEATRLAYRLVVSGLLVLDE